MSKDGDANSYFGNLMNMSVDLLRLLAGSHGVKSSGRKADLQKRLLEEGKRLHKEESVETPAAKKQRKNSSPNAVTAAPSPGTKEEKDEIISKENFKNLTSIECRFAVQEATQYCEAQQGNIEKCKALKLDAEKTLVEAKRDVERLSRDLVSHERSLSKSLLDCTPAHTRIITKMKSPYVSTTCISNCLLMSHSAR